ncbi:MAG TPA: CIA30 family protein [Opitutus sp.]|nr:CIA30 family protein [Opitutus sp.]
MKSSSFALIRRRVLAAGVFLAVVLALGTTVTDAAPVPALLDNFSDATRNAGGAARLVITDKDAGGSSHATQACENGVLTVQGELQPGRGMPGFISLVSLLSPEGQPQDVSAYQGVKLRVRVKQGIVTVQVASAEIQNFDYHTSGPIARSDDFREVRIPFKDLKRAWSEQTPLNLRTVTCVNLVAAGMARGAFAYEVDEIGFY